MNKIVFFVFVMFITVFSFSQLPQEKINEIISNSSEKELVEQSTRLMYDGFLFQSESLVDKLLTIDPASPNYNYRKGYLILESRKDAKSALPFLLVGASSINPNYDAMSAMEKSSPTDAYYHLGKCYHLNQDLNKAIENYNLFIMNSGSKLELQQRAKMNIEQCEIAKKNMAQTSDVKLMNLGSSINSQYPDFCPVISLDGTALYFTSRRPWSENEPENLRDPVTAQFGEDVYVSYLDFDQTWTPAERMEFCIKERNEATVSISQDERRIYVFQDSTGSGDIYYTDFYAQKFNNLLPVALKGINSKYLETHCVISHDQTKIFFTSERIKGYGGRDLYVMKKNQDGTWTEPINLGPEINGPYDEDAPFVTTDNKKLYYSTNGKQSMGGYDVMVSELNSEGNWSTPKNMGYPLNTTFDEIYYTTTIDGLRGYYTSSRVDGLGEKDIYEVDFKGGKKSLANLKGHIRTRDFSPMPEDFAVSMLLKCTNCEDGETERVLYPRVKDGIFLSDLKPCKTYELTYVNAVDKQNMYKDVFTTECTEEFREVKKEVILDLARKTILPVKNYKMIGVLADKKTETPLDQAKIEIYNAKNELLETVYTSNLGEFEMKSLSKFYFNDTLNLQIKVSKENYLTQTFEYSGVLGENENIEVKYFIEKPYVGMDIASSFGIKQIFFDYNKSLIRESAKVELDKIIAIMNDNPTLEIEYGSHTDCRGSDQYNMALSDKRAKASAAYIKAKISNPDRITGKGYGESQPAVVCPCEKKKRGCTEAEHQANRRTEFKIVKQ